MGTNFSSLGWGKKGGEPKFFQNLRGGTKALHTMSARVSFHDAEMVEQQWKAIEV